MSVNNTLENILISLGKDNKPTYVAMGVAAAKGIFRPLFTMQDKKQDPDTKKYTAIREGLTELIAIPVYWGSGKVADALAKKLAKPSEMDTDVFKRIVSNEKIAEPTLACTAKTVRKDLFKMRTNLSMMGVFLSALLVIPAVCSAVIKPTMCVISKKKPEEKKLPLPVQQQIHHPNFQRNITYKHFSAFPVLPYGGMKVGGV